MLILFTIFTTIKGCMLPIVWSTLGIHIDPIFKGAQFIPPNPISSPQQLLLVYM
jgi:hypothetical protein